LFLSREVNEENHSCLWIELAGKSFFDFAQDRSAPHNIAYDIMGD
jgi:hypothetical protein